MTASLTPAAPPSLTPAQLTRTWLAAQHHGGGFVSALATAWFAADPHNRRRMTEAFPEVVVKFGPGSPFYPSAAEQ
jgi:hypothetical protein